MIAPKLDGRSVEDILALIKQKSEFYTPEWLLDYDNKDGGAALAQLFAEMFHGTIDRFNQFPDKCYLEFLNMIGVCAKSVSPALGMAAAELVEGAAQNVFIKSGTQLFTDVTDGDNGDKRVVFETSSGFFATQAKLCSVFMTAPQEDIISRTEISDETNFPLVMFDPDIENNIERHAFALSHSAVLSLNGKAEICVKISDSSMVFNDMQIMRQLCSSAFAVWSYMSPDGKIPLHAEFQEDHIVLTKPEGKLILTDYSGSTENAELASWIFCEMKKTESSAEIKADHIWLNSRSLDDEETGNGIIPAHIFINDNELNTVESGYCFGKEPAVYDSMYIECSEAFSKSGAEISLELSVSSVILKDNVVTGQVGQEFNSKLLVDKEDTRATPPDDIYISDVMWEYWNGYGWARLDVRGTLNPFSCHGGNGKKSVKFICPPDFSTSVQNAYEGLWLRIRVREVENRLSMHSRWLVPWLRSIDIRFDYGSSFLPAKTVSITNSCETTQFDTDGSAAEMRLFRLMPDTHNSVYFRFDKAPAGYPVNFYMELADPSGEEHEIIYQYLALEHGGTAVWRELKAEDRTHGFSCSGILSLYTPADFAEHTIFGVKGFWIRAVDLSAGVSEYPQLCSIKKNAVSIVQKESVSDERLEFTAGKLNQELILANNPVISCTLWVNESGEASAAELTALKRADSSRVRMVTDADGQLVKCWVRWDQVTSFAASAADDRHYILDSSRGMISFGDGVRGRIPAYSGNAEISVDYSFGGGSAGNLPAGAIDGLIVGIPFVGNMTNFEPTCGGSNGQSLEAIREIGAKRLKHRGRAVTAEDYEALVLEEFPEVGEVRCFSGRNRNAKAESGCVTIVVKPEEYSEITYSLALCRRIEEFLIQNAGCVPVAAGQLSVIPARIMRVSAEVTVRIDDYEYSAHTERLIIKAINEMMGDGCGGKIGCMPTVSGIYSALKRVEHISYISRVLLTGEYYSGSERIIVPLDDAGNYRYFIAAAGNHTVRF